MQKRKDSFGWNLAAISIVMGNLVAWGAVAVLVFNVMGDARMALGGALVLLRFFFAVFVLFCGLFSFVAFSSAIFVEGQEEIGLADWLLTYGCVTLQIAILLVGRHW